MSSVAQVAIHPSQFPDRVRADLVESLRARRVNHKFHYDSVKQTQKWLALHRFYSPSRIDPGCAAVYDQCLAASVAHTSSPRAHLIGLGCGGGQKDTRLLKLLREAGKEVYYTPSDVSTAMVLVAREAALAEVPADRCFPLVCDLAAATDLATVLARQPIPPSARLLTFFGMLPNFEPDVLLPRLSQLVGPEDSLLLSANLAPGDDYAAGVRRILPLYDNDLTRDWLTTFLFDLGVETGDGNARFCIEEQPARGGLSRVTAYFDFLRPRSIRVGDEEFAFRAGESMRLFFSYRHTPESVRDLLERHRLRVLGQWITDSEEEGVFLARRARNSACEATEIPPLVPVVI